MGANLCKTFLPDKPGKEPRKVYSSKKLELFPTLSFFLWTFSGSEVIFLTCDTFLLGVGEISLAALLLLFFLVLEGLFFYFLWISRLCYRWVRMGSRYGYLTDSLNSRKECSSWSSSYFSLCLNYVFSRKNGFLFFYQRAAGLFRLGSNLSFILIYIIDYSKNSTAPYSLHRLIAEILMKNSKESKKWEI